MSLVWYTVKLYRCTCHTYIYLIPWHIVIRLVATIWDFASSKMLLSLSLFGIYHKYIYFMANIIVVQLMLQDFYLLFYFYHLYYYNYCDYMLLFFIGNFFFFFRWFSRFFIYLFFIFLSNQESSPQTLDSVVPWSCLDWIVQVL